MAFLQVDFYSEVMGMCMNMNVILPQVTKTQIGMKGVQREGKYPVLYLLHGMSDDHTTWHRRTSIERYVSEMGIAVIMPSVHLSYYADTKYEMRYWTYVSEELPEICCSLFPNISEKREDTFAAGNSMGGYGAMKLGFGASHKFSAIAALSGAFYVKKRYQVRTGGKGERFWTGIFGNEEQAEGSENDLLYLAQQLKLEGKQVPDLYAWCGTEDSLLEESRGMVIELKKLGYTIQYEESEGAHCWHAWDEQIQKVLKWISERL